MRANNGIKKLSEEWFTQSNAELKGAKVLFENSLFEQACFNCHQAVEFALKGLIIFEAKEPIISHNLRILSKKIKAPFEIEEKSTFLNEAYQDSRYVDRNKKAPSKIYTYEDAKNHIDYAEAILEWTKKKKESLMK